MAINIKGFPPPPPPPPHLRRAGIFGGGDAMKRVASVRNVLLCLLILLALIAVPAASAQAVLPTANATQLAELEERQRFPMFSVERLLPCGLPVRSAALGSGSLTLTMTGDCVIRDSQIHSQSGFAVAYMSFTGGGPYTINGNGYTITGPSNAALFQVANAVTLNLNNVNIRSAGSDQQPVIYVTGASSLDAENVGFYSNRALAVITADGNSRISLTNAKFRGNRVEQAVVRSTGGLTNAVTINQADFQENRIDGDSIISVLSGSLTLEGRIGFRANRSAVLGREANRYTPANNIVTLTDTDAVIYTIKLPKKKEDPTPAPTATPQPDYGASYTALQTETGMIFEAAYGLDSGVHFRQLDGAGIGVQSIIDAGYLAALDVYGYVEQGVEVCFPQIGRVIFLDARTMPRAIVPLESTVRDGMTCVSISSPGSLVLLPSQ